MSPNGINFFFSYMNSFYAMIGEIFIFAFITFFILMPIISIYFQCYPIARKIKINRISSNSSFLNKFQANFCKCLTYILLKIGLTIRATITCKRTKLTIKITRQSTKFFTTCFALNNDRWSSTFLRTIMSIISMFMMAERFAASFTIIKYAIRYSTFPTTNRITISDISQYQKCLATNRTDFFNPEKFFLTSPRTKLFIAFNAYWYKIKNFLTILTDKYSILI